VAPQQRARFGKSAAEVAVEETTCGSSISFDFWREAHSSHHELVSQRLQLDLTAYVVADGLVWPIGRQPSPGFDARQPREIVSRAGLELSCYRQL